MTAAFPADGVGDLRVDRGKGVCRVFCLDGRVCGHCLIFYELQEHGERPLDRVAAALVGSPVRGPLGRGRPAHPAQTHAEGGSSHQPLEKTVRSDACDRASSQRYAWLAGRVPPRQAGCGNLSDQRRPRIGPESHACWRACRAQRLRPPIRRGCHRVQPEELLKSPSAIGLRQILPVHTKRTCFMKVSKKWARVPVKSIARAGTRRAFSGVQLRPRSTRRL